MLITCFQIALQKDFVTVFICLFIHLSWFLNFAYLFIFLGGLFFFLRAILTAYGGFQARGRMRAAPASLYHSHSNAGSKPHLRPTPELMAMPGP